MIRTPPKRPGRAAAALLVCLLAATLATAGASGAPLTAVPSNVTVTDTTLERSTVEVGEEAVVDATVTNGGETRESYALRLTGDGEAYVQTLVTLDPGETLTVTFRQSFERSGAYDLAVNGVPAGTLTVTDAGVTTESATRTGTATPGAPAERNGPGITLQAWFLLVLVVGALGAGGVYLGRGRRSS